MEETAGAGAPEAHDYDGVTGLSANADTVLIANDGKRFHAHRLVIAMGSTVLDTAANIANQNELAEIPLDHPADCVHAFLDSLYPCSFEKRIFHIKASNVRSLLRLADELNAPSLTCACEQFLVARPSAFPRDAPEALDWLIDMDKYGGDEGMTVGIDALLNQLRTAQVSSMLLHHDEEEEEVNILYRHGLSELTRLPNFASLSPAVLRRIINLLLHNGSPVGPHPRVAGAVTY